ncbi:MAG: matrixin family metalloprotease [Pirellulaceae bacterium]|nr:matrixin family metalloprotease [Pirellulaceae bacterium]
MFDNRSLPSKFLNERRLALESLESRRMLAASVGWDGPGLGNASLTYYIANNPSSLSKAATTAAIEKAFATWTSVANITFTPTTKAGLDNSIDISFQRIDGSGGTLAQAYLPKDVNRGRIAGDIQFDSSEVWEVGNSLGSRAMDLIWVAVHEIGHSLGLDHTTARGSVLAASASANQSFTSLVASDVAAIRSLYAAATTVVNTNSVATNSTATTSTTASTNSGTTTTGQTSGTDTTNTTSPTCHRGGHHGKGYILGLLSPNATTLITKYDTNKDGSLTQDEVSTRLWTLLVDKAVDTDGNSIVTATELQAAIDAARVDKFTAKDTDGNGLLSQTEIGDRLWRKISAADTNSDAGISIDELKAYIETKQTAVATQRENRSYHELVDQVLSQFRSGVSPSRSFRSRR